MIALLNRLSALGLLSTALSIATSADARQVLPIIGVHTGDHTVVAVCPPGQVMTGLSGRVGVWIDQIRLMCAVPMYGGSYGPATAAGGSFGGMGGDTMTQVCDGRSHVYAVQIDLTADAKRVGTINLYCAAGNGQAAAEGPKTRMSFGQPIASSRAWGQCEGGVFVKDCSAATVEATMHVQYCNNESALVGFTVRYGGDVNSIGFICDTTPRPVLLTGKPR